MCYKTLHMNGNQGDSHDEQETDSFNDEVEWGLKGSGSICTVCAGNGRAESLLNRAFGILLS